MRDNNRRNISKSKRKSEKNYNHGKNGRFRNKHENENIDSSWYKGLTRGVDDWKE